MAKPGSSAARRLANGSTTGAVDLKAAAMSDTEARQAQEMVELELGMRCHGCGRRVGMGLRFTSIGVREQNPVVRLTACKRDDCDFMKRARDGATCAEMIEFAWMDDLGLDAPPAELVVRRNEMIAEQLKAQAREQPQSAD